LKEVQKIKQFYGKLRQKDIERIAEEARESKERNYDSLVKILESRLATFVYRAKWAATIFGARQLVNHGHIRVNDHKVDIWSYRLKVGDKVSLCDYMRENPHVVAAQNLNERTIPEYIKPEGNFVFSLEFLPNLAGTYFPCKMNFSLALDLLLKF